MSMTYPAFGNNVVGKALHIGATSLKHCNFHATLWIEMHMQRCLCEVVVLVEIAGESLRQFARFVVQSRNTRMGARRPPWLPAGGRTGQGRGLPLSGFHTRACS